MTVLPSRLRPWAAALLLVTLAACGGGGGRDPVMGFDGAPSTATPVPGGPSDGPLAPGAVALGAAAPFGAFGGSAGLTNQGLSTAINNGAIGTTAASTLVTGFHDATPNCVYTETNLNKGNVTGGIFTAPPPPTGACPSEGTAATFAIATEARAAALAAYNALVAKPPGAAAGGGTGDLAGLTLPPGTYTSAPGSFMLQSGDLHLDAGGNPDAVWVFQMATTLTVGAAATPSTVFLDNGAQAKNVFWQVGSAATINPSGGGTFVGTVISQAAITTGTAGPTPITTVNGRLLSLTAVTLVNTVINVP